MKGSDQHGARVAARAIASLLLPPRHPPLRPDHRQQRQDGHHQAEHADSQVGVEAPRLRHVQEYGRVPNAVGVARPDLPQRQHRRLGPVLRAPLPQLRQALRHVPAALLFLVRL
eukprot:scaffold9101_cov133-Isochrysis_galbana.AAC.2